MAREKLPEHTERAMTACRNAKPESKQYELLDSKIPGLELRVNAKGKEWSLRYRVKVGEKWLNKRLPLGDFPAVTVANARSAAQQAKTDIARGSDPMGDRRKEAELRAEEIKAKALEEASRVPVAEAFERWMKSDKPAGRHDGGAELRRLFERDVLPKLGKKTMSEVNRADILEIIDEILARGANRMAQSAFADIRQFFEFSTEREIISANPCAQIKKSSIGKKTQPRERYLDPWEIRELDRALRNCSLNRVTQIIYMLQIGLTCRINELCQAAWTEIDWNRREWTIPAAKNKSRREITIALSRYSLSLLRELQELTGHTPWLYPGLNESKPVNRKQATNHARDRQRPIGEHPIKGRTIETRSLVVGSEPWTPHDLRRSGTTIMQRMGIPSEISERCLNHAEGSKTKQTYHRHDFDQEMKRAWFQLSEALSVISGDQGEEFLKELAIDDHRDMEDQVGFLGLVKKFYVKPID
ncbi:tyrosine-type recombinase/integrase [Pseudomonas plecoglossicida]|uniref:tyrosine-type recombinase/integrase n=1 Tax=Pseudomonas putida group TaxID=136845 RepID=UPI002410A2B2|nr:MULTISPECIES: site-specific integrase [Pseudomonas putida group]MDQ7965123.1 tyrosine-type recombinase/integrase [Pseudomonas plecoglossicida]WFG01069.1 tyrosine-type recombinase/integrase [Pseudomonas putida]